MPPLTQDRDIGRDSASRAVEGGPEIGERIGSLTIRAVRDGHALGREYLAVGEPDKPGASVVFLPEEVQSAGDDIVRAVLQEAKAAAQVQHPGIVRMLRVGREGRRLYFVTEDPGRRSAADLLADGRRPGPREATRVALEAARVLGVVHRARLTHRDVRPDNLRLADDGSVRLAGLGMVRAVEDYNDFRRGLPLAGPTYASPELYRTGEAGPRSDLYSLGAVYFHLLTGRPPFTADTSLQVLHKHCVEPVPDPAESDPQVPLRCRDIVARAMAKDPVERFPDAAAMAEELEALLAVLPEDPPAEIVGEPEPEPAASPLRRSGRSSSSAAFPVSKTRAAVPARPRSVVPWLVTGTLAVAVSVFAGAAVLVMRNGSAERVVPPEDPAIGEIIPEPPQSPPMTTPEPALPEPEPPQGPSDPALQALAEEFAGLAQTGSNAGMSGDKKALEEAVAGLRALHERHKDALDAKRRDFAFQAKALADSLSRTPAPPPPSNHGGPAPVHQVQPTVEAEWVAVRPDGSGATAVAKGGTVAVWDAAAGTLRSFAAPGTPVVAAAAFTADGTVVAAAAPDGSVRLIAADSGAVRGEVIRTGADVRSLAVSPDAGTLVVGGADGEVTFVSAAGGGTRKQTNRHTGGAVSAAAFAADGSAAVTAGGSMVYLWKGDGEGLKRAFGAGRSVGCVAISGDGRLIAAGNQFKQLFLWETLTGQYLSVPGLTVGELVTAVALSRDGRSMACGLKNGELWLADLIAFRAVGPVKAHTKPIDSLSFSADGRRLVSTSADRHLRIWDAEAALKAGAPTDAPATLKPRVVLRMGLATPAGPSAMLPLPGGRRLAAFAGGVGRIWDTVTGEVLADLKADGLTLQTAVLSPDGRQLAASAYGGDGDGGGYGHVVLFSATDGRVVRRFRPHATHVRRIEFSADGRRLATLGGDADGLGEVRIWSLDDPGDKPAAVIAGHHDGVHQAGFTAGGRSVYTIGAARNRTTEMKLWNAADGRAIPVEGGSLAPPFLPAPDGSLLAMGPDGHLQLWDTAVGKVRAKLPETAGAFGNTFSADGRFCVLRRQRQSSGVVVLDLAAGRTAFQQEFKDFMPFQFAFSGDASVLAMSGMIPAGKGKPSSMGLRLLELRTGRELEEPEKAVDRQLLGGRAPVLSADGSAAALWLRNFSAAVWRTNDGKVLGYARTDGVPFHHLQFLEGGRTLALFCMDGTIRLFDIPTDPPAPAAAPKPAPALKPALKVGAFKNGGSLRASPAASDDAP